MRLKTPRFWYSRSISACLMAVLLWPFSILYRAVPYLRQKNAVPFHAGIPVICVGNLTAGGNGKTPAAIALMKLVNENGIAKNPCFLSRGYGGTATGPIFAHPVKHTYKDVGDEPLLLARHAPVIVSRDRKAGALFAQEHGHDLVIMDDGLQNPRLAKTLSFVVLDSHSGFGNGHILPAGPLREPLAAGFEKSDAFIIIGSDARDIAAQLPVGKPVFHARLAPGTLQDESASFVAFCGLGQPDKFRRTLREKKLTVTGWHEFPDHYPFTPDDLGRLDREALRKEARLLTTEKDAARIPPDYQFQSPLDILPVTIAWQDETTLLTFLKSKAKP
ncbi:MAG TPA: tetraacyldisaccharide 4'-kinase [Micavibrio sp.]